MRVLTDRFLTPVMSQIWAERAPVITPRARSLGHVGRVVGQYEGLKGTRLMLFCLTEESRYQVRLPLATGST